MFSTMASPNTKDNIANIYGTKTLTALIALNLRLELQPTSSQVLNELDTGGDESPKGVTIAGHISRPVFGEGRSTPDRQMFFVNSRPCLLPQIAKAFNEVYKSYNVTQSPFVFANLKMDTNAYDVNVSPDKRTILLHDQNSLLNALKQSLIQLFEAQEQTVPRSQIPASKLPSYRPLMVSKEGNRIPPAVRPAIGDAVPRPKYFPSSPVANSFNAQSTEAPSTFSEDGELGALLSEFVERNLQDRNEPSTKVPDRGDAKGPSKDKLRLAKQLQEQSRESGPPQSTASENPSQASLPRPVSKAVEDFNARLLSQHAKSAGRTSVQTVSRPQTEEDADEEPIPSNLVARSKPSPIPLQSAFEKMSSKRALPKAASINAESSSSSRLIDSPAGKKRKLDSPVVRGSTLAGSQSCQFAQRMHGFAAPGSQLSHATLDPGGSDDETVAMELGLARPAFKDLGRDRKIPEEELFVTEELSSDHELPEDETIQNGVHSGNEDDDEYIDETERRKRDEAKVEEMVRQAEATAVQPSQEQQKRATNLMKSNIRKDSTLGLVQFLETTTQRVDEQLTKLTQAIDAFRAKRAISPELEAPLSSKTSPEERLSLTIAKSDFEDMRIIGQFNLGFILATRSSRNEHGKHSDELFIIDQHASDEIYNFSRLSLSTTLTPQPLVRPHPLELTAIEEETILSHIETLAKNGFNITLDESGDLPVGQRCHLLTLPTSRETVFDTRDLEELISLLGEVTTSASEVIRPTKVRKMLAMRACRSSIMIGRTLTHKSMESVVRHMGEIGKPWNCPHGRPTMRHLASLGQWRGWQEGEGLVDDKEYVSGQADWRSYVERQRERGFSRAAVPDAVRGEYTNEAEDSTAQHMDFDDDNDFEGGEENVYDQPDEQ